MIENSPEKLKILYVEDDHNTMEEVATFLQRRHYQLFLAENGRRGLELFHEQKPDLVVSDIRMPEMGGLEMIAEIKTSDPEIQTIVTSAYNDVNFLQEAIELGVEGYVLKPIDLQKLLRAIEKCSSHIFTRRALASHTKEREQLIQSLQEALGKVKLLKGFIPICCNCKKIRNDQGYWEQVEAYLSKHSEAQFSHGICPDCANKLYPEFDED